MRLINRTTPVLSGALVALAGLLFVIGGSWLAILHGSLYYLTAGLGLVLTGIGLIKGRRWTLGLYGVVWLGSVIWALWESGLNIRALEPRILLPTLLGLYLLLPGIRRHLSPSRSISSVGNFIIPALWVLLIAGLLLARPYPDEKPPAPMTPVASALPG